MARWTTADLPDQRGRTFVVTGANSGLGLETAKALVAKGAHVILACRDAAKAEAALRQVERAGTAGVAGTAGTAQVRALDLADLHSVRAFVADLGDQPVDTLINNAGIMAVPLGRTAQGFERQFGTNVLGHFLLTALLTPRLSDRVVWLSSAAHRTGEIDLDDLNWERRPYNPWRAYGQSKLADLMLAYEMQRRLTRSGSRLRSVAAHPGYSATNLQHHTQTWQDQFMGLLNRLPFVAQPAARGALPSLYAATVEDLAGGTFVGPDGFLEAQGYPRPVGSSARSHDRAVAAALWSSCEELTGQPFAI